MCLRAWLRHWQRHHSAQIWIGRTVVRDRHCLDELGLEFRLDRRLYLLDPPHQRFDQAARPPVKESDPRARAGSIPGRAHLIEIAVRQHAEHRRVFDVDMATEGTCQPNAIDGLDA